MNKNYNINAEELNWDDMEELERLLIRRWKQLCPEWELVIISLPLNDPNQRKKILDSVKNVYTSDEFERYCIENRTENAESNVSDDD